LIEPFPWRLLWFLLIASLVSAAVSLPFVFEVFRPLIENSPPIPIPIFLLVIVGVAQNFLLFGVIIGVGLLLARKIGLGAPLLESWLYRRRSPIKVRDSFTPGAIVGIAVGIVLVMIILSVSPHMPGLPFVRAAQIPVWKRLLACFYGGVAEEVLTRLFLLSLLAWLGLRFFQKQQLHLSSAIFWIANIIVAVVFGLGHLPAASRVMQITPEVVLVALLLNGIAAIPFGWLYWKRGLESAMIAHFCADFVLWVVGVKFL
jgi:membrane protease YdiL (CAAX protease family)